jgi:hypothetical protein
LGQAVVCVATERGLAVADVETFDAPPGRGVVVPLPGDMLPFKAAWEKIAGNPGTRSIVLPPAQSQQRAIYEGVVRRMQALGKTVRLISSEQV